MGEQPSNRRNAQNGPEALSPKRTRRKAKRVHYDTAEAVRDSVKDRRARVRMQGTNLVVEVG